jgi:hypothetical protein
MKVNWDCKLKQRDHKIVILIVLKKENKKLGVDNSFGHLRVWDAIGAPQGVIRAIEPLWGWKQGNKESPPH